MTPKTLVELIQQRSSQSNCGVTFIDRSDNEEFLSYQDLYTRALRKLGELQQLGIRTGDELVFQIEDNQTFLTIFWACILGGVIPVPLSLGNSDDHKRKLFNVWKVLNRPFLICNAELVQKISKFALSVGEDETYLQIRRRVIYVNDTDKPGEDGQIHNPLPVDLAFIQFSSGSTGSPKGVMLTHGNLLTNISAIAKAAQYKSSDSSLSWMPLTHDMGLIGFHLNPMLAGMDQLLMPTPLFIRNPSLWLTKASEHQATVLCSPNFGYRYLLKHMTKADTSIWDLSSVRIIYNGAEPISAKLGREFLEALAPFDLSPQSMCPVYGLAEASLAVSMSRLDESIKEITVDRNHLAVGEQVAETDGDQAVTFVNVGKAIDHVAIRIVNESSQKVRESVIGHIQISGKNVTSGYYNNPSATDSAISEEGWLSTGDLGFVRNGTLFVTGRVKDIFFSNGQNFYPHDIERIAEDLTGVELNKIAVAGYFDPKTQQEEVLAFVLHRGEIRAFIDMSEGIQKHVNQQTGIALTKVIPVREIPKTTSGKLQRFKLLEQFKNGDFAGVIQEIERHQLAANGGELLTSSHNPVEQEIIACWKKLFRKTAFHESDRFFEIGGNSLKAAELVMMIHQIFEVEVDVSQLYHHQTIGEIALLIETASRSGFDPIPRSHMNSGTASIFQKRLFYFWMANKASTTYNVPVIMTLNQSIDENRLKSCLRKLVERHEILRASFYLEAEEVCIKIHEHVPLNLEVVDGISENEYTHFIQPFDLGQPGLFRFLIIRDEGKQPVLCCDFHHAACDGLSVSILLQELQQLYNDQELDESGVGYLDFIAWYEMKNKAGDFKLQHAFWKEHLEKEIPKLTLPIDRQRLAHFDHKGGKVTFNLDKKVTRKLRLMASRYACSMHVMMFSIYSTLLHKLTQQQVFSIGLPVSVRNHREISKTTGMFVNNLPVVTKVDPEQSFRHHLIRQKDQISAVLQHIDFPFDAMVNEFEANHDTSRNPMFDTMFIYQNMDQPEDLEEGLSMTPVFVDTQTSKYDLSQEIFDSGAGELNVNFEYASALFDGTTIDRFVEQYQLLIDRILRNEEARLKEISLLSSSAFDQHIFEFNDTEKKYSDPTVLDSIERQLADTAGKTAILASNSRVSYEELWSKSDQVAKALRKQGIGTGYIVPVCMNRSTDLIVTLLGVWKSGAAYLPIELNLPQQRIEFLVKDSRSRCLLTNQQSLSELRFLVQNDFRVFTIEELEQQETSSLRLPVIKPDHLAYVLYTSGTTGEPKGVKVSHGSLCNYISWAVDQYTTDHSGSFAFFTSISFDLTITSIFTPLASGYAIVMIDDRGEEHHVINAFRNPSVHAIKVTPAHLTLLKEHNVELASQVSTIVVGGEAFKTELARMVHELFDGNVRIYNEYGPTEATVGCMIHQFDPTDKGDQVPIGVPAANTSIYLLDEHLNPVPEGVEGELFISGTGVAAGYLFRPELTESRFLRDPFSENQRMYKSGDHARRRSDGKIIYVGRSDDQLKIDGHRIEPFEVARHLTDHEAVLECVVGTRKINGKEKLYAYYLEHPDFPSASEGSLKGYLKERLPHYMVPVRLVALDNFPLTQNGKVDHQQLAQLLVNEEQQDFSSSELEISEVLLPIWKDILKVDVTITDNFFELGGDSIKAVQIAGRLREKGLIVNMQDILIYHTIQQLVGLKKVGAVSSFDDQDILAGQKELTPIEHWFFDRDFQEPSYYNQSVLLTINRPIDPKRLADAFDVLIEHHDGLHLNFNTKDQTLFFNERHLRTSFSIEEIAIHGDLSDLLPRIKAAINASKNLLLKAAILKENDKQAYLFITAHHLIIDGVSWHILLHDLDKVYHTLAQEGNAVLPPKTSNLVHWQRAIRDFLQSRQNNDALEYWDLVDEVLFQIPVASDQERWYNKGVKKLVARLDSTTTDYLIHGAHQQYGTNVPILLNLALIRSLQQWIGGDTFVIEHENHGRHLAEVDTSRLIGWFTAIYPVKLILSGMDLGDQIISVKEQMNAVPDHGLTYWSKYLDSDNRKDSLTSEIRLNYLGVFEMDENDLFSFSDLDLGLESAAQNHLTTKIEINALVLNGRFKAELIYHEKAFVPTEIQNFTEGLISNLEDILSHIKNTDGIFLSPSDFDADLDQKELDELFM